LLQFYALFLVFLPGMDKSERRKMKNNYWIACFLFTGETLGGSQRPLRRSNQGFTIIFAF